MVEAKLSGESSATRERIAKLLCVALCVVLLGHLWQSYGHWKSNARDEAVFWMAGERLAAGDAKLYEPPRDESNLIGIYIYPPAFAALFAPLTFLDRDVGRAIWAVLQAGFLAGVMLILSRHESMRSWQVWAWVLLALIWPIIANISMGQVNSLVLFLCVLAWQDSEQNRHWRCGFWIALGLHIKVLPVVLLGVLVAQRKYRAIPAVLVFTGLICLLPLPFLVAAKGVSAGVRDVVAMHDDFLFQLARPRLADQFAHNAGGESVANFSIGAQLDRFASVIGIEERRPVRWLGFALAGVLYVLALWRARNASKDVALAAWGLCLAAAILGNVLAWPSHMVMFAMFIAPAIGRSSAARKGFAAFMIAYSLPALVAYQAVLPIWAFDAWLSALAYGLVTLMALVIWVLVWFESGAAFSKEIPLLKGNDSVPIGRS